MDTIKFIGAAEAENNSSGLTTYIKSNDFQLVADKLMNTHGTSICHNIL